MSDWVVNILKGVAVLTVIAGIVTLFVIMIKCDDIRDVHNQTADTEALTLRQVEKAILYQNAIDITTDSIKENIRQRAIDKGHAQYNPKTAEFEWLNKETQYIIEGVNDE